MRRLTILVFFILLACSKDSPIPDAVVPTPILTKFTLAVAASEGGSVNTSGGTFNENTNVSVTASPADGFTFTGWTGDATGSTNPLTISMNGDKNITATFSRSQYAFSLGVAGQGSVDQELVSSAKSKTDYESGSTIRLTANSEPEWIFYRWDGLSRGFIDAATGQEEISLDFDNPIEVVVNSSINATATFEQVFQEEENPTGVVGKWKIRKPKSASKTGKAESNKTAVVNCSLTEIIFRTDGSFTIATGTTTVTGQFIIDSNTSISLTQSQSPFGTITNLVITNNFINFSISLASGCDDTIDGDRDNDYNEDTDTSLPPVISLVGESIINIELGSTFTDPGATASDNVDGDLTSSITSSGTVNTATEGTYTIVYSVSDADGNIASVSRTVIVSLDLPPTITLTGSATINLLVGDTYIEDGCVATDAVDGDITSSITTSGTVDTSIAGTYTVVYSVTDSSDNSASVLREVVVNTPPDTTAPSITLTGSSTINLTVGETFTDPGATARDDVDGNLTSSITTSGAISTSNAGTFTISYSVSDAAGNSASVQRTVIVSVATNSANCTISGQNIGGGQSQTVTLTSAISDITFTVNSSCQENLQEEVIGLPTGVTLNFSDNTAIISGTPTGQTGDYSYVVNWYSSTSSFTLGGTITVVASSTTSTSTNSSISFVNGTCECPNAIVGDTAVIGGVTYTAVDNSTIAGEIANGNVNLCTTLVTDMSQLIKANSGFNFVLTHWDTSNVTNMSEMFYGATSFNSDISSWDTSNVTDMGLMFRAANTFNQNIGNWNTSGVSNMNEMFRNAWAFNKDIGSWDTSNVSSMGNMFASAFAFNQNIGNWNTSNVTDMSKQFKAAEVFNQDLTGWCVSSITSEPAEFVNLSSALIEANKPLWGKEFTIALTTGSNSQTVTATNAITDIVYTTTPICAGSISASASGLPSGVSMVFANNVATISGSANGSGTIYYSLAFTGASTSQTVTGTITINAAATTNNSGSISFINGTCQCPNATAGDTDVINGVTYTAVDNSTIAGQIANSNVNLCTTLVTSMQNLFSGKANFNSDIGFWDTSNVTNMDRMFENASSFNQDISGWCVSNINSEPINFLFSSALTDANKPVWGTCPSD